MFPHKAAHPFPRPATATALTPTTNQPQPNTAHLVHETTNPPTVARHGVVIQPTLHDAFEPASRLAQRAMHSLPKFRLNRLQRRTHTFRYRVAMDREPTVLLRFLAHMREAKKIETLRSALAASFSSLGRIATELDQTRLRLVKFQPELRKTCAEFFQTRLRFMLMLKTDHEIVRVAHDDHVAAAAVASPPFNPEIENVVQVHVRKQG